MEQRLADTKHLRSEIRDILSKPIEERIHALEQDMYIQYELGDLVLLKMERILSMEKSVRPVGMLISSPSGNGKTTILKTFAQQHQPIITEEVDFKPVVSLQAPPSPGEKRFLGEIVKAFGLRDYDKGNAETRLKRVIQLAEKCRVRMLIIDEIHNLLSGSPRQLEESCNLIKYLANELGLSIVLAGTERAENVIASDLQLISRFPISNLPRWKYGSAYKEFLTYLESTIPLPKPSNLANDDKATYLLKGSGGILGHVVHSVKNAGYEAITKQDQIITFDILKRNSVSIQQTILQ